MNFVGRAVGERPAYHQIGRTSGSYKALSCFAHHIAGYMSVSYSPGYHFVSQRAQNFFAARRGRTSLTKLLQNLPLDCCSGS